MLPALVSGAGRALSTTSKVSRAANFGRKFLGRDPERKKPKEIGGDGPAQIIVRPMSGLVPKFDIPYFSSETPPTSRNKPQTESKKNVSLEENVAYIRKKTIEIDKLFKESFRLRKKEAKEAEKMRSSFARKEKERRFESGKKGVLGKAAEKVGRPFSGIFDAIKNYITSILVGFIAIKLLPLLPKFLELLKIVGPAMDFILGIAGKLLDGLVTFIDWGYKAYDATRGFVKGIGGEGAAKAFDKVAGALNTMINLALILAMAQSVGGGFGGGRGRGRFRGGRGRGRFRGGRSSVKPGQGLRPKVTTSGGRGVGRPDIRSPFRQKPKVTTSGGRGVGFKFTNPFKGVKVPAGGFRLPKINPKNVASGVKGLGIGLVLEYVGQFGINWTFDRLFGTREEQTERFKERQENRSKTEQQAVIDRLLTEYKKEKEWQKSIGGKLDKITALGGETVSDRKLQILTDRLTSLGITPPKYQMGGQVEEEDGDDKKKKLKQSQILPLFSTPDIGIGDVGKDIGGIKEVEKLYKARGIQNLLSLYKEVKNIPVYGEAMATTVGMALGIKPTSVSYLTMGASLINFSNLQAAENITSSTTKINQAAQKFETGGQVIVSKVSLDSSLAETANVAQYLRNQISSIDIKPEEERSSDAVKNLLKRLGIDFSFDGQIDDRSPTTPPNSDAIAPSGGPSSLSGTNTQKWKAVYAMAQKAGAKYPELVAAQFALESAWGTALAGKNNFFGIKGVKGGDVTISRTREVINGKSVYVDEPFKNFNSPQDAINHLVKEWYKDYKGYRGVNNAPDAFAAAMMLKSEGYATDPVYAQSLQRLLREYSGVKGSESDISSLTKPDSKQAKVKKPKSSGILGGLMNMIPGAQDVVSGAQNLKGTVVQWLHGNPNRKGYRSDHAGMSNAHDHFSFNSRSAAVRAFKALKKAGYAPYEFEGFTAVGKHSPRGGHFGAVGQPPTYDDKTDGTAFDIPWSSYGSGPIGKRDYDKSYRAAKIVGAAQGGGPVPGEFKGLQQTMRYDKSKTKILIQPMIVEKDVPMPIPGKNSTSIISSSGMVNNTADSLVAG